MPTINAEKCTRCRKCENDCPSNAININLFTIDPSCIQCGHCVAICPEQAVIPDQGEVFPLENSTLSGDDFRKLSATVRSCRSFLKKDVPDEIIAKLIENMKHYPSASNARPVQVTVIKTPDLVQKLNDLTISALVKSLTIITYPFIKGILRLFLPHINIDNLLKYREKLTSHPESTNRMICYHAPVVMLFHAPASSFSLAGEDAFIWATYTSIYANTLGLGTCFIGFIIQAMKRDKKMKDKFGIPANHTVHSALIMGYPKVSYRNEVSRQKPMSTIM